MLVNQKNNVYQYYAFVRLCSIKIGVFCLKNKFILTLITPEFVQRKYLLPATFACIHIERQQQWKWKSQFRKILYNTR